MIRKKLVKWVSIVSSACLLLGLVGSLALAGDKKLTPLEYTHLTTEEKIKYRTVTIRPGPQFLGLGAPITEESIPDIKNFQDRFLTADIDFPWKWYSEALFLLKHPEVKFESGLGPWDPSQIVAALAAGTITAPFPIVVGGGIPAWMEMGAVADITDLVKDWDQNKYLWENFSGLWKDFWFDGRCYGVPSPVWDPYVLAFRKDWFKEAGIFDKEGTPRPEDDWTYKDMREIAVKLTDPKKKRWGFGYNPRNYGGPDQWAYIMAYSFGVLEPWGLLAPDKSGKSTWRFTVTPQTVETFQYLHDLRWKYECMISDPAFAGPWDSIGKDFYGGRAGMARASASAHFWKQGMKASPFNPDHIYSEDVGMAPFPQGEKTGLRYYPVCTCQYGFAADLTKEELKLAFDFWDWGSVGIGATLRFQHEGNLFRILGPEAVYTTLHTTYMYKIRELPAFTPKREDIAPAEYLRVADLQRSLPAKPQPVSFGLRISQFNTPAVELPYVQGLCQKIVSDKDLNIEAELENIAKQVNKEEDISYKIEGDQEKLKKYYAAVEDFFKETYPAFYESEMFKEIWEKYYKIW